MTPGCGQPSAHTGHVILRSQGGPDTMANLAGRCFEGKVESGRHRKAARPTSIKDEICKEHRSINWTILATSTLTMISITLSSLRSRARDICHERIDTHEAADYVGGTTMPLIRPASRRAGQKKTPWRTGQHRPRLISANTKNRRSSYYDWVVNQNLPHSTPNKNL
jgi:hypothetical protein